MRGGACSCCPRREVVARPYADAHRGAEVTGHHIRPLLVERRRMHAISRADDVGFGSRDRAWSATCPRCAAARSPAPRSGLGVVPEASPAATGAPRGASSSSPFELNTVGNGDEGGTTSSVSGAGVGVRSGSCRARLRRGRGRWGGARRRWGRWCALGEPAVPGRARRLEPRPSAAWSPPRR